jgi:hypothetical protein
MQQEWLAIARKHLGQLRAAEKSLKSQEREKVKTTGKASRRNHPDLRAILFRQIVSIYCKCTQKCNARISCYLALVYRLAMQVRTKSNKLNKIFDSLIG